MFGIIKREDIDRIMPTLKPNEWIVTDRDTQFWIDGIIQELFPNLDKQTWTFAFCENCEHSASFQKVSHLLRQEFLAHKSSRVMEGAVKGALSSLEAFSVLLGRVRGVGM